MKRDQLEKLLDNIQALSYDEQKALFRGRDLALGEFAEEIRELNKDYIDQIMKEIYADKDVFEAIRLALIATTIRGTLIGLTLADAMEVENAEEE